MRNKNIIKYYSRMNLGDDLFIVLLAKHFPDIPFEVVGNPVYFARIKQRPKNLKQNILLNALTTLIAFLSGKFAFFEWIYHRIVSRMEYRAQTIIQIGGSLFMEPSEGVSCRQLEISKAVTFEEVMAQRKYKVNSLVFENKAKFIIGANIGPVYTMSYMKQLRESLSGYTSVCVRDLYSYAQCSSLNNVLYAPDVIYNLKPLGKWQKREAKRKRIVFSVIRAEGKQELKHYKESYYKLLAQAISQLSVDYDIDMVSFCEPEGDLLGIEEIQKRIIGTCKKENICIHRYDGDIDKILQVFERGDYIVASRFHAMILGTLYNKPIFPICYGAKMLHYLQDLRFEGKIGLPSILYKMNVNDLMYNFTHKIECKCEKHKINAKLQFEALERYLYRDVIE